jgi:rod shape-determining protein MreC
VLLEFMAMVLIIRNNNYHFGRYLNLSQDVNSYFENKIDNITQYLSLNEINQKLASENAYLKNQIEQLKTVKNNKLTTVVDTSYKQQYTYLVAKVVNNSTNKQYNYITLNKGTNDGIKPEMAVISPDGVVGVVESVSKNFSLVMSVLNRNMKVSAKFKKNGYFGSFEWSGENYQKAYLLEIPTHVNGIVGDTIVTTGFSTTFPGGVLLGFVKNIKSSGGNFYNINLEISTDFKKLNYVYVVTNYKKGEQLKLESLVK